MLRLRSFVLPILSALLFVVSAPMLPAAPQGPFAGAQAAAPLKSAPSVVTLLNAGNKAQTASPPQYDEAERLYTLAVNEARKIRDKVGEERSLRNLGNNAALQKQFPKALDYYQQSLAICREIKDNKGEGDTYYNMAILYSKTDPGKKEEFYRQAITGYHAAGDSAGEAHTLAAIGVLHMGLGHIRQAKEAFTQAAVFAHSAGLVKAEADAIWYRADLFSYDKQQDPDRPTREEARADFLAAALLYHKVNDLYDEAWTYQLIGDISNSLGRYDAARSSYLTAASLYRKASRQKDLASVLSQLANFDYLTGHYVDALNHDQAALTIYRKLGDKRSEAIQLMHMATIYRIFGQTDTVFAYEIKALPLLEQAGDTFARINALMEIQAHYWLEGDHAQAQVYLKQLMPLLESPATGLEKIRKMDILAAIYYQTGNYAKEKEILEQTLPLQKEAGLPVAYTFGQIGGAEEASGNIDKALEYYNRELELLGDSATSLNKALILDGIASIEKRKSNFSDAERHLKEAVALEESVRNSFEGLSEAKSTFLSSRFLTYQLYLSVLLAQNKSDEAFALVQKMKARSLLDILVSGKVQFGGALTPEERQEEKALRQKSDALNFRLVKEGVQNEVGSKKRAEAIKAQLIESERELQAFQVRVYAKHPDVAAKRAASTITLEDTAKFLPEDTALLEYITLKAYDRDETILFVVTQHNGVPTLTTYVLPITLANLSFQVNAVRDACSDPRKPYRAAAQSLYQTLVAPAETRLAGKKRLLICPDGVLWDVPFAALLAGSGDASKPGAFLMQQFEIAYAYSATGAEAELTAQANGSRRQPTKTMLAFANPNFGGDLRFGDNPAIPGQRPIGAPSRPIGAPSRRLHEPIRPIGAPSRPIGAPSRTTPVSTRPIGAPSRPIGAPSRDPLQLLRGGFLAELPGTQQEARAIKTDFPNAVVHTKDDAQEAIAKREAGNYRYLHFATHGFFNDAAPLLSAIVLALPDKASGDDGFLTAREIFDLNLHADMVVLSACNTARGEKRNGEGMIGLTWALFAAGAPTQVVSQWAVNDQSTALLMQRFYANLTKKHMAKGQALRSASLSLLNEGNRKYAHPYYWAPFILLGNWGK